MNTELLGLWFVCAVLLFFKMWSNSLVQGFYRLSQKQFTNPEDAQAFGKILGEDLPAAAKEHPMVERASACWRNDLENIPMFLILSLGFILLGGGEDWGQIYLWAFVVARVLHTLCYFLKLQPWRNLAYDAGALLTIAVAIHGLMLVAN